MESEEVRFVVIIAQGRSGSTLILRLLNGVPGVRISGENLKSMDHLRAFAESYRQAEKNRHSDFYKLAWQTPAAPDRIMQCLRQLFVGMHGPGKLLGFKEIRYGRDEPYGQFAASLDWLRQLLPGLRIVFNTRDTESRVKSNWWAKRPRKNRQVLKAMKEKFNRYVRANQDCCYWMPYEELRPGSAVLRGLVAFLGLEWKDEYERPLDVVMRG